MARDKCSPRSVYTQTATAAEAAGVIAAAMGTTYVRVPVCVQQPAHEHYTNHNQGRFCVCHSDMATTTHGGKPYVTEKRGQELNNLDDLKLTYSLQMYFQVEPCQCDLGHAGLGLQCIPKTPGITPQNPCCNPP